MKMKKADQSSKKKQSKSGGFQSMGLSYPVLKGVLKKGYKVPTPIQRKTIPVIVEGRDVVAMARTGSGKTAAFLLPLFEKLKCRSAQSGARALILSPTRELALQTLKFTKELGRFCNLKPAVILGGNKMEDQFAAIHENPDIIIATPGRFLHIVMEMDLKLSGVEYVVFDEADRLFEMGFQEQLQEIINRLPDSRQTLLFSATLPRLLVDFAKAGLHDPVLIRLDVETQLSDQLKTAYFSCHSDDKPAVLLHLLKNVVPSTEMTVVFVATKHHVEYLKEVLLMASVPCSYVYSSLDQTARKINVAKFQTRKVKVLLVTDVAARGIDIPLLDNVINYNFPAKPKLFVHRVGRVARAGRSGTAYSLVSPDEAPFLLDLHLFLGRPIKAAKTNSSNEDGVFGSVPQSIIDEETDLLKSWHDTSHDLMSLQKVSKNAYKQYLKSRPLPSPESVKRIKEITKSCLPMHPLFKDGQSDLDAQRSRLLKGMHNYRPKNTIFEIGRKAKSTVSEIMAAKRLHHGKAIEKSHTMNATKDGDEQNEEHDIKERLHTEKAKDACEEDIQNAFSEIVGRGRKKKQQPTESPVCKKKRKMATESDFKDKEYFVPYHAPSFHSEKGLGLEKSFDHQASSAVLDFMGDEENLMKSQQNVKKWDRKKKRFVGDSGTDPKKKKIKTESGVWIPASYKSNLYKQWKNKNQIDKQDSDNDEDQDDDDKKSGFGKKRPGLQKKLQQAKNKNKGGPHGGKKPKRPPKRELKTKEEILKSRMRKARLQAHMKRKHGERMKRKAMKKKS